VGPRSRWTLILLGVLAVLATVTLVLATGDDDDDADGGGAGPTETTLGDGPLDDEQIAGALLPQVGALGPTWIETARDDRAQLVTAVVEGDCPPGPVPEGYLIRGEHRRTQGQEVVEALAVTAGIVAEGVEPPSLDDDFIAECLLTGLQQQVAGGSTVTQAPDVAVGPSPAGAIVSHVGFVVDGAAAGQGGTFDFVLVRRDRLVSLGLLTGTGVVEPTSLAAVAAALDAPLQAVLPRVG
jgi:hypothetical protein